MSLCNTMVEIKFCFDEFKQKIDILHKFLTKQEKCGHPQAIKFKRQLKTQRQRLRQWRSLARVDKTAGKVPVIFRRFTPAGRKQVLDYLGKITDSFCEIINLFLPPLEGQLDNIHQQTPGHATDDSGIEDPSQGNAESIATYWEELRKRLNSIDLAINCLFELVPPRRRDARTFSLLHVLKGLKKSLEKRI
ncbi:hypothetical protein FQN52_009662 [Onygenales sp. PD_12]|nr:hypothetical protein FQN52_009662 [Onygenales sp. PD_12]